MNKRFETMQSKRLTITAFDMKYLDDYYHNFDKEITQYQYPDPFDSLESARWRVCWQTSNRPSRIHGMSTRRICAMNQV